MRQWLSQKVMVPRIQSTVLVLSLFALNFYICHELFATEYLRHMASIEGVFIALARFATAHANDLTWFPLWAGGVPYHMAYPPLLPLLAAALGALGGFSPAHAYHWVVALLYCLGPLALFALALRLSGSRWAAFAAGLIYSSLSVSAWLVPGIANDLGSPFFARRLQALVYYGEGPHVCAITLLTLAVLCLDLTLEKRRAPYLFLAAAAFAATATINWLGAFATVLAVVPYLLARLGSERPAWRDLAWTGLTGVAAYCLALPWIPPSTIAVLARNAKTTGGDYAQAYSAVLPDALAILAALAALKFFVRRWPRYLQFVLLFAFLMTVLSLADEWWGLAILPMAARYHLDMEMALALLAGLGGFAVLERRPRWIAALTLGLLVIAVVQPIRLERRYARNFLLRSVDIRTTIEWKKAQWMNGHWTGGRVLIAGSSLFWWSAFSDIPQLWGVDQGTTNNLIRDAQYAIYNSDITGPLTAANAVLWLKAMGVQAVGVSGPGSSEQYKAFPHPRVFEGMLDPIWRGGDDVIYRVSADAPPARVIPRSALVSRALTGGLDVGPLRPYVAALDDPALPRTQFTWTTMHSARIAADLGPGQVISLQMSWSNGWHSTVNGRSIPVRRDGVGLMYIDPETTGPGRIELFYDGGLERLIARAISLLTALVLAALSVREFRRRLVR